MNLYDIVEVIEDREEYKNQGIVKGMRVQVIVEKKKYADEGVHKGMVGWICDPRTIDG